MTAYHAALEERTRERVPLDWARTQMNLGNALRTLGLDSVVAIRCAALRRRMAAQLDPERWRHQPDAAVIR